MSSEETEQTEQTDETERTEIGDEPVSPKDARLLIARNEADVIDIRSDEEAFGHEHVPGARRMDGGDEEALKAELPEDGQVLLVCESGERSAELAATLRDEGRSVGSIEGGLESWKSAGLPVQPGSDKEFEGPSGKLPGT